MLPHKRHQVTIFLGLEGLGGTREIVVIIGEHETRSCFVFRIILGLLPLYAWQLEIVLATLARRLFLLPLA